MPVKISAWLESSWSTADIVAVAHEVEAAGCHGIWVADHFMDNTGTEQPSDKPKHECFSLLAGLATVVPRVRLGSLVAGITYRHPAVLANIATTIDHLSSGRFVLGIGAGWQLNEHAAYGIELGPVRERMDRFDEAVAILRGLFTERRTTAEGKFYTVVDAPMEPKPVQSPLPLLIGGSGEKRMLATVAATADEWNCWSTPEVFARKSTVLDAHCEQIGRDPKSIWRTTQAFVRFDSGQPISARHAAIGGSVDQIVDAVGQWQAAGLNEWIVPTLGIEPGPARELLGRIVRDVVPQLS
jgi:F420-dependent oxidoreductase-like protein